MHLLALRAGVECATSNSVLYVFMPSVRSLSSARMIRPTSDKKPHDPHHPLRPLAKPACAMKKRLPVQQPLDHIIGQRSATSARGASN
jgi:hypothetical protein